MMMLQSLYGMLEDDYDYEEVRVHLEPSLQQFIRASCTTPTNMHTHLIHATMLDLSTSEKVGRGGKSFLFYIYLYL